jgi:hypothetical protein
MAPPTSADASSRSAGARCGWRRQRATCSSAWLAAGRWCCRRNPRSRPAGCCPHQLLPHRRCRRRRLRRLRRPSRSCRRSRSRSRSRSRQPAAPARRRPARLGPASDSRAGQWSVIANATACACVCRSRSRFISYLAMATHVGCIPRGAFVGRLTATTASSPAAGLRRPACTAHTTHTHHAATVSSRGSRQQAARSKRTRAPHTRQPAAGGRCGIQYCLSDFQLPFTGSILAAVGSHIIVHCACKRQPQFASSKQLCIHSTASHQNPHKKAASVYVCIFA